MKTKIRKIESLDNWIILTDLSAVLPITYDNTTGVFSTSMATARLIGRTTAGTGVFEEIVLGANMSFVGNALTATVPAAFITAIGNTSTINLTNTLGTLTAAFASMNISQFTNDSGYITGNQTITLSGDVSGSGTTAITTTIGALKVATGMIQANAVTYAKMQAISSTSLLLGSSSTTTAVQEITIGTGLSLSGTTLTASGSGGTVTSVAWTTSQGVSASISNPTTTPNITIALGALTGITSLNGLVITANTATVTTGIWNGTTIGVAYGGTNIASYAVGDLIYASGATTLAKLADVAVGSVLVSGGVTTAPAWSASPTLTTSLTVPLIYGGTASGGTMTLSSTSHATKGNIYFGGTTGLNYDEANTLLGIGVVPTTTNVVYIKKTTAGSQFLLLENLSANASASSVLSAKNDAGNAVSLVQYSSTAATANAIGANNAIFGCTAGDFGIVNNGSGKINFWVGSGATNIVTMNTTGLGIGMTPAQVLDITLSQNAISTVKMLNSSAGTAAGTRLFWSNGTNVALVDMYGTGFTTSGGQVQDGALFGSGGAGGVSLAAYGAAGVVRFYAGDLTTLRMRVNSVGNIQIGGTAAHATTAGVGILSLYNNTAPAGTITNGASFFCTGGEMKVIDAGGTITLLSPHSKELNEIGVRYWVYDSVDTMTKTRLVIDMEKMMKKINEKFGWDFVHQFAVK